MFYDLKVTFDFVCKVLRPYSDIQEFGILLTEDFYEVLLSWRFIRGYVRHNTRANIVAHIPWISHSMNFGQFYSTFYVTAGNFSGTKLQGKNTTAWYFRWRKKENIFFGKWASFVARILGSKSTQKSTCLFLWNHGALKIKRS